MAKPAHPTLATAGAASAESRRPGAAVKAAHPVATTPTAAAAERPPSRSAGKTAPAVTD